MWPKIVCELSCTKDISHFSKYQTTKILHNSKILGGEIAVAKHDIPHKALLPRPTHPGIGNPNFWIRKITIADGVNYMNHFTEFKDRPKNVA